MSIPQIILHCVVSEPFAENTFIAHLEGSRECLIFDPGFGPAAVIRKIEEHQLVPVAILNTHGHSDHIAGNEAMKRQWPNIPLIIGRGDEAKLTDANLNLSAPFGVELISPPADQTVQHGETLELAKIKLQVRETPGHSVGHVVFVWHEGSPKVVFGGDVLFRGSVGRTDFPDGDTQQLVTSIHEQLYSLPDNTIVLPGHGESTTIGEEKRSNPFVGI